MIGMKAAERARSDWKAQVHLAQHGGGADDQGGTEAAAAVEARQKRRQLDGLAQPHLIADDAACALRVELPKPLHPCKIPCKCQLEYLRLVGRSVDEASGKWTQKLNRFWAELTIPILSAWVGSSMLPVFCNIQHDEVPTGTGRL
jgi:hypothetical protein